MEMTMKMGAFEALDNGYLMEIEGGSGLAIAGIILLAGVLIVGTKGCADADKEDFGG